jgi:hypothetical protein
MSFEDPNSGLPRPIPIGSILSFANSKTVSMNGAVSNQQQQSSNPTPSLHKRAQSESENNAQQIIKLPKPTSQEDCQKDGHFDQNTDLNLNIPTVQETDSPHKLDQYLLLND